MNAICSHGDVGVCVQLLASQCAQGDPAACEKAQVLEAQVRCNQYGDGQACFALARYACAHGQQAACAQLHGQSGATVSPPPNVPQGDSQPAWIRRIDRTVQETDCFLRCHKSYGLCADTGCGFGDTACKNVCWAKKDTCLAKCE